MAVNSEKGETKEVSSNICSGLLPGDFLGCIQGGTQRELGNLPKKTEFRGEGVQGDQNVWGDIQERALQREPAPATPEVWR